MKIRNDLPQFIASSGLIVSLGKQSGVIYEARSGDLIERARVGYAEPSRSDREGYFERRGKGMLLGVGSIRGDKEIESRRRFARKAADELRRVFLATLPTRCYLFAPSYMLPILNAEFPADVRSRMVVVKLGNFIGEHPFALLEMIGEREKKERRTPIASPERFGEIRSILSRRV